MSFEGKVVLITGAASGIGAATALRFAQLSAQLALVDIKEEQLKITLSKCEEHGSKHLGIIADLSRYEDILTIVPKTIERYGRIDVLVNAAAVLISVDFLNEDVSEKYDSLMAVNLKAPIILTNKAAPFLVESKGNIVNIASIASSRALDNLPLYCVSKAGLEMFSKCMALELGFKGVRANSVHPGGVRTDFHLGLNPTMELDEYFRKLDKRQPFGLIEPDEVAKVITFLASDDAKRVTGSAYYIDSGHAAMNIDVGIHSL